MEKAFGGLVACPSNLLPRCQFWKFSARMCCSSVWTFNLEDMVLGPVMNFVDWKLDWFSFQTSFYNTAIYILIFTKCRWTGQIISISLDLIGKALSDHSIWPFMLFCLQVLHWFYVFCVHDWVSQKVSIRHCGTGIGPTCPNILLVPWPFATLFCSSLTELPHCLPH